LCRQIIEEDTKEQVHGKKNHRPKEIIDPAAILKPAELKAVLDEYVIGQEPQRSRSAWRFIITINAFFRAWIRRTSSFKRATSC
jgi:ATP-dependent protease Clp ATPase subunit